MVMIMLNNGNNTNCDFADDIVSYIYNETGEPDRKIFETHLAHCTVCTDEFAAISNARFSVFEWRKEEFAHLLTPEIKIPYAAKKLVVKENDAVGLLVGLRGLLSKASWPVTAAAGLVLCLGVGFMMMTYFGGNEKQLVAANQSVPPITPADSPNNLGIVDPVGSKKPDVGITTVSTNYKTGQEARPVRAVAIRRQKMERQMTADNQTPVNDVVDRNAAPKTRKAPVLSSYEDNDDKSLRLSDLFDEVGG